MVSFADLTANLRINTADFATGLRNASKQVRTFANDLNKVAGGGARKLTDEAAKSAFHYKDVARVIQGIMLSRVFYAGLQSITSAAAAVWEFSNALDYAKISYSNLFGDVALADEFINVLKDFAAKTPFDFKNSEESARRLLAYGIEYKNVMYVMQGVLSASSMTKDPQTIERVSRALGQIYTKGRLMNEELRQLAESGVNVYKILEEKLHLTKDQIADIGRQRIPASTAINALVDGMNEKYGAVVEATQQTMTGIISNIHDNLLFITQSAIQPLMDKLKETLGVFGKFLAGLREISDTKGLGGVFEALVPKEMQGPLRQLIANIIALFNVLRQIGSALGNVGLQLLVVAVRVANILLPPLTIALSVFSSLLLTLSQNTQLMGALSWALQVAAVAWAVFSAKAALAFILGPVIKLILTTAAALKALAIVTMKNPWGLVIGGIALAFIAVAMSATSAGQAIRNFFGNLLNIVGINPDKILLPEQKNRVADLSKFNKALSGTSKGMDKLADSTSKTAKAAKSLLSFDEVFSLKAPDDTTGTGGTGTGGTGGIVDGSSLIPEVPDFAPYATDYANELSTQLQEKLTAAGIGSIIGGIIGGLLTGGNPIGIALGALAGGMVGYFWEELSRQFGFSETMPVSMAIGGAVGGIVGFIVGGPLGAGIGVLAGGVVGGLWDKVITELDVPPMAVATALGLALVAVVANAGFINSLPAVAGGIIAGLGAALAAGVADIGATFALVFTDGLALSLPEIAASLGAGGAFVAGLGVILAGAVGFGIGSLINTIPGVHELQVAIGTAIGEAYYNSSVTIGAWIDDMVVKIQVMATNISLGFNSIPDNVRTALENATASAGSWLSSAGTSIMNGFNSGMQSVWNGANGISSWLSGRNAAIDASLAANTTMLVNNGKSTMQGFMNGLSEVWESIVSWLVGRGADVDKRVTSSGTILKNNGINVMKGMLNGMSAKWNDAVKWLKGRASAVKKAFGDQSRLLKAHGWGIVASLWDGMKGKWSELAKWLSGLAQWIKDHKGPIEKDRKLLVDEGAAIIDSLRVGMQSKWSGVIKAVRAFNAELSTSFSGVAADVDVNLTTNRNIASIPAAQQQQSVVDNVVATLAPMLARVNTQQPTQVLYVGALIADERSLAELNRKMKVIQLHEDKRTGS